VIHRFARQAWTELNRPRGRVGSGFYGVARRRTGRKRGIALLMAITALMILTVLVADVTYSSRVRLLKASHDRDAESAYWLAVSGANLYQLVLIVDKQISKQLEQQAGGIPGASEILSMVGGLWEMLPGLNTGLLRMMFVSGSSVDSEELEEFRSEGLTEEQRAESREGSGLFSDKHFLDFEGDFIAEVVDENSKVSLALIKNAKAGTCMENVGAQLLYGLMSGEENDQWFYDRNLDRWELICNVLDWVDIDTTRSSAQGGYEDNLYNRLDSPYLTKNAFFDTPEELRLVEGWQDDVYDRFAQHLTIYNTKTNVNTAPDEVLRGLIVAYAEGTVPYEATLDVGMQKLRERMALFNFSSASDFRSAVEAEMGVTLKKDVESVITTDSEVFTVTSTGIVGDSSRTLKVVYDFSSDSKGKILYWRLQ